MRPLGVKLPSKVLVAFIAGVGLSGAVALAATHLLAPPTEQNAASESQPPNKPAEDLTAASVEVSEAPRFLQVQGLTIEDDPHVWSLLEGSVSCRNWAGGTTEHDATLMDLLRLRRRGHGSLPFEYRLEHVSQNGHDYVVIHERIKQRDGSDVVGMPGFVQHRYLYVDTAQRFEHLESKPDDPSYGPDLLRALDHPVSFLTRRWDAVCNGRLTLPEVRAELQARRNATAVPVAAKALSAEKETESASIEVRDQGDDVVPRRAYVPRQTSPVASSPSEQAPCPPSAEGTRNRLSTILTCGEGSPP